MEIELLEFPHWDFWQKVGCVLWHLLLYVLSEYLSCSDLSSFELSLSGRTPVRKCVCSPIAAKDQHFLDSKMGHRAMSEIRSVKLVQVWPLPGCRLAEKQRGDAGTATQNQCLDSDVHKIRCQFEKSLRENIWKRTGDPLCSKLAQEWTCL